MFRTTQDPSYSQIIEHDQGLKDIIFNVKLKPILIEVSLLHKDKNYSEQTNGQVY